MQTFCMAHGTALIVQVLSLFLLQVTQYLSMRHDFDEEGLQISVITSEDSEAAAVFSPVTT